jgi:hypothetical protein
MHNTKLKAYTHNNNILLATTNTLETERLTLERLRMGNDERERERGWAMMTFSAMSAGWQERERERERGVTTFRIIIATKMKMEEKRIKL